ncbi:hypothetical protein KOE73_10545 [Acidomonas methanolica]|nr:hypothetical protein [Acidomonas methanolica]MBU2654801.1 hypothetical protein [Acidomonas methanolica]GBQ45418.1 hypothetical protein AA0498_0051 [Acidomonas methanolica]
MVQVRGSVLRASVFRGMSVGAVLALAACAQKPLPQHIAPPNPFGYQKVSAVCQTSPVKTAPDGSMSVSMKVRSDDGLCSLRIQQPGGKSYASFGVDPSPTHGKAFLYNYDDSTVVDYTPTTAYAGPDRFVVILIAAPGKPRTHLAVDATVDATGVPVPKPVVPAVTAPTPKSTSHKKTRTRSHSTHH